MLYRILDIGVREWDITLRAWVAASSAAQAAERVQTVMSWLYGISVDDVGYGNVGSAVELEDRWGEPPSAGDRRWIQHGVAGRWPLYDRDDDRVLYLVRPKQRVRLRAAYAAAAEHERELAAAHPQYAKEIGLYTGDGAMEAIDSSQIPAPGIGGRIGAAAERIGTRTRAAAQMQVSVDSLQRYIREDTMPPFDAIARLCARAGVSIDWIATGVGPMTNTSLGVETAT